METMNFTVYSRDGCPYCVKIAEVLQLAELKHVIYKLDRDFDRPSFYGQFGQGATFPQVVLNTENYQHQKLLFLLMNKLTEHL